MGRKLSGSARSPFLYKGVMIVVSSIAGVTPVVQIWLMSSWVADKKMLSSSTIALKHLKVWFLPFFSTKLFSSFKKTLFLFCIAIFWKLLRVLRCREEVLFLLLLTMVRGEAVPTSLQHNLSTLASILSFPAEAFAFIVIRTFTMSSLE